MRTGAYLLLAFSMLAAAADVAVLEEIVAKVNGDIVTRTDLDRLREQLRVELEQRGAKGAALDQAFTEREKDILRDKVDQLLVIQKGKELNINVDSEISKQLAQIQTSVKISDPDKFAAFIKEQTGLSVEDYKQGQKDQMIYQRVVRDEVGRGINIPQAQIQAYYNEHKNEFVREERIFLREIFVSTEGKDAEGIAAAEKKAKDLVARARKGEKFPELARDNSDNAETAPAYGELPPQKKEDMRKDIADAVWGQPKGTVTEPIKLANGFEILRVEEQHKAGIAELEEVRDEIMEKLYMPAFAPRIREYMTKLRSEAYLEIKPGYEDTGAAPGKNTAWTDPTQLRPETITKEEVALQPLRRKRMLWMVPMPGTKTDSVSSSK